MLQKMNLSYSPLKAVQGTHNPYYSPIIYLIMSKKVGVVVVTKAENAQLGLLLKYIFTNETVYESLQTHDVLKYPDAFTKLCGRYSS